MISPAKQALADASARLPEDCSWDDVMYTLYVRQKIQQGLSDADQDKVVDHEVVFAEIGNVSRSAALDAGRSA